MLQPTQPPGALVEDLVVLHQALRDLVRDWESEDVYDVLTAEGLRRTDGASCGLYLIDPKIGAYRRHALAGVAQLPKTIAALPRRCEQGTAAVIQQMLRDGLDGFPHCAGVESFHRHTGELQCVAHVHVQTVYAFLLIQRAEGLADDILQDLRALTELAFVTLEHRDARMALAAQEKPIDITADAGAFYDELAQFLEDATRMQFVALRERGAAGTTAERDLRCTAISGWDLPRRTFDLPDFTRWVSFNRAIEDRRPTFSPDRDEEELQEFWEANPHLSDVESFAVFPIADGERVAAVLSLASSCRVDFTETFISIVGGIARYVGFTLKNRELYFERRTLQWSAIETAAALDAVEVFSDLGHQIRNRLTEIPESLELLRLKLKKREIGAEDFDRSVPYRSIESAHDRISELLHQAADVTEPPRMELARTTISSVWNNALDLVRYRLEKLDIAARCQGDITLEVYPVLLRQVLFHLLLNSIAAFADRRARSNRKIELYVTGPKGGGRRANLRYVDNAGGINPGQLRYRGSVMNSGEVHDVEEAIFRRGVTSRDAGTGHGLWIVRQILQRHRGSIELNSYRGGVVFDISLPIDLRAEISRRKEM
jgi:signal transduction histidine kinase